MPAGVSRARFSTPFYKTTRATTCVPPTSGPVVVASTDVTGPLLQLVCAENGRAYESG